MQKCVYMNPVTCRLQVVVPCDGKQLHIGTYATTEEAELVAAKALRALKRGVRLQDMTPAARRSALEVRSTKNEDRSAERQALCRLAELVLPQINWEAPIDGTKHVVQTQDAPAGPRRIQLAIHALCESKGFGAKSRRSFEAVTFTITPPRKDHRLEAAFRTKRKKRVFDCSSNARTKAPARITKTPPEKRRKTNTIVGRLLDLNNLAPGSTLVFENSPQRNIAKLRPAFIAHANYRGIPITTHIVGNRLYVTRT